MARSICNVLPVSPLGLHCGFWVRFHFGPSRVYLHSSKDANQHSHSRVRHIHFHLEVSLVINLTILFNFLIGVAAVYYWYIFSPSNICIYIYIILKKGFFLHWNFHFLFSFVSSSSHSQAISHTLYIFLCFAPISICLILISNNSSSSSSRIFLGFLGFGLSILFCTTFCRACSRFREEQIEREAWRRSEQDGRPPSIYFIPFPGNMSQQDSEDHIRVPRYSQELQTPPQYGPIAYSGPPPSYNEVILRTENFTGQTRMHHIVSQKIMQNIYQNMHFLIFKF